MYRNSYAGAPPEDWGARAVWWLKNRFPNWPMKAVARELDETESVIKSWFDGTNLPSRQKLQKLRNRFGKEGFSSFVFGEPCREEMIATFQTIISNVTKIEGYLHARDLARKTRKAADSADALPRTKGQAPAALAVRRA